MVIQINGESQTFGDELSAAQLIEQLGLTGKRLAMEVNCEIVPRSTYDTLILKHEDKVEIVRAIGGG